MSLIQIMNYKEIREKLILIISVITCLFHLYVGWFGISAIIYLRSIHLMLMGILVILLKPLSKKNLLLKIIDIVFIVIFIVGCMYLVLNFRYIVTTLGKIDNFQVILGLLTIIAVLEATRRVVGGIIPGIAIFFIIYAYFGPYFGPLAVRSYSLARISSQLYLTTEGIFGSALGVSASYVILFIIFGAFIEKFGGAEFFLNVSSLIGKNRRSGPALTAVVGGGLFGTISGSAVANVSTVGGFTIPLMKKVGFSPTMSAAILALSGTGGQIAPPVMGAAAFVVAELVGVPYLTVVKRAIIPAILFYLSLAFLVDLYAEHHQIKLLSGIPGFKMPSFKETIMKSYTFLIPVTGLFYLLIKQYSAARAATVGILLTVIVAIFIKKYREKGIIIENIVKGFYEAAKQSTTVALTCACAGIIIGITNLTGLGLKISSFIISLSGGNLFIALLLTMLTCLLMGMGLPTTAAYIIVAILGAPALIELGVPLISAHLFIFYFAVISNITPPVCLAAYASAGIAGSDPMKSGFTSSIYGAITYIIPYFFIYRPSIMGIGSIFEILSTIFFMIIGIFALSIFIEGYFIRKLHLIVRMLYGFAAIFTLYPSSFKINLLGLVIFIVALCVYLVRGRNILSSKQ